MTFGASLILWEAHRASVGSSPGIPSETLALELKRDSKDQASIAYAMSKIIETSRPRPDDPLSALLPGDSKTARDVRDYVRSVRAESGASLETRNTLRATLLQDARASFDFVNGALRSLPAEGADEERRILVDLVQDSLATVDPKKSADLALDLMIAAAKRGAPSEGSNPYASSDSAYQAQLLLFSLPVEPRELLSMTGEAGRKSSDRAAQLLLARHLLARHPELTEEIQAEVESWGLTAEDLGQSSDVERAPASE